MQNEKKKSVKAIKCSLKKNLKPAKFMSNPPDTENLPVEDTKRL